jgi:alpha-glucosidase
VGVGVGVGGEGNRREGGAMAERSYNQRGEGHYLWWQRGIVYQVYPRSYQDTDGDGVGDLRGITQRLDHLRWLGVDAIWLSPIYPSPMADFGYDVADYTDVDPLFGTLADFDQFVGEAHSRGLKVIMDFVPNHSSSEHPWFKESRASRDSPKRDWYIWKDPAPDGGPPTNWLSNFGGPGWTLDERTDQYYYHAFLPEQPDLNWRNPEVVEAMLGALRFWLERGVDGFRIDVIWHVIKDDQFRDNPPNPDWEEGGDPFHQLVPLYTADRPEVHDVIVRMRQLFDQYSERVMIGEIYLPVERLVSYYGTDLSGVHLPFNFQLIKAEWDAEHIGRLIEEYEGALPEGGWPNWVLGNHDQHRIASRVGADQARVAAMMLLTLRGTPTIYYGDEIGMVDVPIPPDRVEDPLEKNVPGKGLGRDPERTPMQWSAEPNAGFTEGRPWLPIAADYERVNVEAQRTDSRSMLALYRRLIDLRRGEPALEIGRYQHVAASGNVLAYRRTAREGEAAFLIALNFGGRGEVVTVTDGHHPGIVAVSTHLDCEGLPVGKELRLRPHEGIVVRLHTD